MQPSPMTEGGNKLAGVDLASKLEERPGILPEEVDVKHGLGIGQVRKVGGEAGVDTVTTSEVGDTAGHGHLRGVCVFMLEHEQNCFLS